MTAWSAERAISTNSEYWYCNLKPNKVNASTHMFVCWERRARPRSKMRVLIRRFDIAI